MRKINVILDTDIGCDIDDLYALYLVLLHPRIRPVAITTVDGDAQAKARLVKKVLREQGRTDIPIGAGQDKMDGELTHTSYVTEADPEYHETYPSAVQVMAEAIQKADGPVVIVPIGMLTNVAEFLKCADESLLDKVSCIAIMGGETEIQMAEYNIIRDAQAADVVFGSGIPIFAGTYSQSRRMYLALEQVELLFGNSSNPAHRTLLECTRLWSPWAGLRPGPVLYDLCPIFWLADNDSVKTRETRLRVETRDPEKLGYTVPSQECGVVFESIDLDPAALVGEYLKIIGCKLAPGVEPLCSITNPEW